MSFVFPILLGGLIVAGVPILLHLLMRQKPKTLLFPAFRFLLQRKKVNQRRLKLRHLMLLLLRVGLIGLMILALARTRLLSPGLQLSSDTPVSAILIFDTSPSMDYRNADGKSLLDEAKKRALELLDQFPVESRFALIDSGLPPATHKFEWLTSPVEIRNRIGKLAIQPTSGPLSSALSQALFQFQQSAGTQEDPKRLRQPRLLCVFSDRTQGCWQADQLPFLLEQSEPIMPTLEGLQSAATHAGPLAEYLKPLREKLPPPVGQDYPEMALLDSLEEIRQRSLGLKQEDFPLPAETMDRVKSARRQTRELLERLQTPAKDDLETYRLKLLAALGELANDLRGYHGLWIDVGALKPRDFALTQLEFPPGFDALPRNSFTGLEPVLLRLHAEARGQDYDTTVSAIVGKEVLNVPIRISAGQSAITSIELDLPKWKLKPGTHPVEIRWPQEDPLAADNRIFGTFAIQEGKRILIVADDDAKADLWDRALKTLKYASEIRSPAEVPKLDLSVYHAIYLMGVQAPEQSLWGKLELYLRQGGNVAIIPGGEEMNLPAYEKAGFLPGRWNRILPTIDEQKKDARIIWNLEDERIYDHPLLKKLKDWKEDRSIDFIHSPREKRAVLRYWEVKPATREDKGLVAYDDPAKNPAILERKVGAGKVLQFTVPLDPREPIWHNYGTFYFSLVYLSARYLSGENERQEFNFVVGRDEPRVVLPLGVKADRFYLRGENSVLTLPAPENPRLLEIRQPLAPGNYTVLAGEENDKQELARFSVNLSAKECDLAQIPVLGPELLLGWGAILEADRQTKISDLLQGRWTEPLDLFPYLMLGLLLFLGLENLLANKFYRREPEEAKPS